MDRTRNYLEILRADVDSGRADQNTHAELSKAEEAYGKKMRELNRNAPVYDGNPKKDSSGVRNWRNI